ncbi:unnamed protein product [Orchesella dallaii]|uniref:Uncharacterized protein n=1 Tax=Orchesella dallaii TaxID=48710 RepID=A0ABP1R576_9HEXA
MESCKLPRQSSSGKWMNGIKKWNKFSHLAYLLVGFVHKGVIVGGNQGVIIGDTIGVIVVGTIVVMVGDIRGEIVGHRCLQGLLQGYLQESLQAYIQQVNLRFFV